MTEFHLPTHFYLRRRRWTVEVVDTWSLGVSNTYGHCDPEARTIEIWEKQPPRRLIGTFVHEYLHAVEYEYGLKVAHRFIYLLERPITRLVIMFIRLNGGQP